MRKTESYIYIIIGLVGTALCFVLHNEWAFLPAVLLGLFSVFMIRRTRTNPPSESERAVLRKRNLISLVGWVVFAVLCFALLRNRPAGAGGLWFALSAYLFLALHDILTLIPARKQVACLRHAGPRTLSAHPTLRPNGLMWGY